MHMLILKRSASSAHMEIAMEVKLLFLQQRFLAHTTARAQRLFETMFA